MEQLSPLPSGGAHQFLTKVYRDSNSSVTMRDRGELFVKAVRQRRLLCEQAALGESDPIVSSADHPAE